MGRNAESWIYSGRCHSRNGGQWPEYAHTLKICVDSFDAQLAEGTLFTYYFENAWAFHSLDQLLFALDSVAQLAGQPQADTELRRGLCCPCSPQETRK